MTPLRLDAPAKLNLSLRIVRRRDDSFHELDGAMLLLELADRLLVLPGSSGLRVAGPTGEPVAGVPVQPDENLGWRGLAAGLGRPPDEALACLALEKRIPAAAGLGGGSSDAAAGWRLGRRWAGLAETPGRAELDGLARIGADVPFFAAQTAFARVRGIGELVEPLDPPPVREVVLVHPPRALATRDVFAALERRDWSGGDAASPGADVETLMEEGRNDLLAAARRLAPELDDLCALFVAAGARPRLTGSGPTLFSLEEDRDRADRVAARLERAGARVTRTRSRSAPATIEAIEEEQEEP